MISLEEEISKAIKDGYSEENAAAKVCQDVILDAISRSPFNRNITIKGVLLCEVLHVTSVVQHRIWILISFASLLQTNQ